MPRGVKAQSAHAAGCPGTGPAGGSAEGSSDRVAPRFHAGDGRPLRIPSRVVPEARVGGRSEDATARGARRRSAAQRRFGRARGLPPAEPRKNHLGPLRCHRYCSRGRCRACPAAREPLASRVRRSEIQRACRSGEQSAPYGCTEDTIRRTGSQGGHQRAVGMRRNPPAGPSRGPPLHQPRRAPSGGPCSVDGREAPHSFAR